MAWEYGPIATGAFGEAKLVSEGPSPGADEARLDQVFFALADPQPGCRTPLHCRGGVRGLDLRGSSPHAYPEPQG